MSNTDETKRPAKTLSLKKTETSTVKQSFSPWPHQGGSGRKETHLGRARARQGSRGGKANARNPCPG